eukprot:scpid89752/ scgid32535/ Signal recognition particle receptor subunit beta
MSLWKDVQDLVGGEQNATILAVSISVGLVFVTTLLIWLCRGSRARGRNFLLIGLNGAGKTLMYSQLRYREEKHTVMSVAENKGKVHIRDNKIEKVFDIVDIPGHDSLRKILLEKYLPTARGIVLVVDSSSFSKDVRDVAKLLFSVLATSSVRRNRASILIACNKQDIPTAKSAKLVEQMLEKEIDALRTTRAAALSDTDDTRSSVQVGKSGKEFSFADVHPLSVRVAECCAKDFDALDDRETDLSRIIDWLLASAA